MALLTAAGMVGLLLTALVRDGRGARQLTIPEIYELVRSVQDAHPDISDGSAELATAIAWTESHGDPLATRQEAALDDASTGLFQLLQGTAKSLYEDFGYRGLAYEGPDSLYQPRTAAYFGLAYLSRLKAHPAWDGRRASLIRAYNGGPSELDDPDNPNTADYLDKVEGNLKAVREAV